MHGQWEDLRVRPHGERSTPMAAGPPSELHREEPVGQVAMKVVLVGGSRV